MASAEFRIFPSGGASQCPQCPLCRGVALSPCQGTGSGLACKGDRGDCGWHRAGLASQFAFRGDDLCGINEPLQL